MIPLAAREGYRLWAPNYAAETAVSFLENRIVTELGVPTVGLRLLDAGCGTARRLGESGAALSVGIDLTPEMLGEASGAHELAVADVRGLPFAANAFDVVWCRLVIGHVRALVDVYAELGRVCRPGGTVVVTDFHPDAAAAGHRRTFRDATGTAREVEHHLHLPEAHFASAGAAGLEPTARRDGAVGPPVRRFYAEAARLDAYEAQRGLRLVLALAFRKP